MAPLLVSAGLVGCFGAWVTVHLSIVAALAARPGRLRALICLLPPLAPLGAYWALKERMHTRAALWAASLVGYAAFLVLAYR